MCIVFLSRILLIVRYKSFKFISIIYPFHRDRARGDTEDSFRLDKRGTGKKSK